MTKRVRPLIAVLLAAALIFCASCEQGAGGNSGTDVNVQFTQLENLSEYRIVMPAKSNRTLLDASTGLQDAIETKTGVLLTLTTDRLKDGEDVTAVKEILLGSTNRPESDTGNKYSDFTIKAEGAKVVINGGSDDAVAQAIKWFTQNCIDTTLKVPADGYEFKNDYPLAQATVNGVLLKDYAVKEVENDEDATNAIKAALAKQTGYYPPDEGANTVRFEVNNTLGAMDVSVKNDGANIVLAVNENGAGVTNAVKVLENVLSNLEGEGKFDVTQTVSTDNVKVADAALITQWREQTDERIQNILSTPNMDIPAGATVYYVSNNGNDNNDGKSPAKAWATLEKVTNTPLEAGSYVCFERGGLWRGQIIAQEGVTYTAYGEGDKPVLYGSPEDGAVASKWKKSSAANVWYYDVPFELDVGSIVFDHGEAHAIKYIVRKNANGQQEFYPKGILYTGPESLKEDLTFYHDTSDNKVYLYSEENPGERFDSVEFLIKLYVFSIAEGVDDVTIDNICVKYTGGMGVGANTVKNLTVQNCEFGWIGGSLQFVNYNVSPATPVRYGNAVQIYGGCDGYTVRDSYFYQIYDAAVTHQYGLSSADEICMMNDVLYKGNVMEYANYSIEYFLSDVPSHNESRMENILFENNYMWYAGEGLSEQRPDTSGAAHIKGWGLQNPAVNFVIKDNLMVHTNALMVHLFSTLKNDDGTTGVPMLENNIFAGKLGVNYGVLGQDNTYVPYTPSIVDYTDPYSTGDIYYFVE